MNVIIPHVIDILINTQEFKTLSALRCTSRSINQYFLNDKRNYNHVHAMKILWFNMTNENPRYTNIRIKNTTYSVTLIGRCTRPQTIWISSFDNERSAKECRMLHVIFTFIGRQLRLLRSYLWALSHLRIEFILEGNDKTPMYRMLAREVWSPSRMELIIDEIEE